MRWEDKRQGEEREFRLNLATSRKSGRRPRAWGSRGFTLPVRESNEGGGEEGEMWQVSTREE